jgi:hypothetical protein
MDRNVGSRPLVLAIVGLVVLATLAAAGAGATPGGRVLVVADAASGEHLLEIPVENGTPVALEYTHSVEGTRVLDGYTIRGDRLVMTSMEFESYGWGLPARASVHEANGTFRFDPDYASEQLIVKPGPVADHELRVRDRTYDLVALSDARAVRLSIERQSALEATLDSASDTLPGLSLSLATPRTMTSS